MAIQVETNSGNLAQVANTTSISFIPTPKLDYELQWTVGSPFPNKISQEILINFNDVKKITNRGSQTPIRFTITANSSKVNFIKFTFENSSFQQGVFPVIDINGTEYIKATYFIEFNNLNLLSIGTYTIKYNIILHYVTSWFDFKTTEWVIDYISFFTLPATLKLNVTEAFTPQFDTRYAQLVYTFDKNTQQVVKDRGLWEVFHNIPFTAYAVPENKGNYFIAITESERYSTLDLNFNKDWLNSLDAGIKYLYFNTESELGKKEYVATLHIIPLAKLPEKTLTINPTNIAIHCYKNINSEQTKSVELISNTQWSVTNQLPIWLGVSKTEGENSANIQLSFQNLEDLNVGTYTFNLHFFYGDKTVNLPITMYLHAFITHPYKSNQFYFSKEDEFLLFDIEDTKPAYVAVNMELTTYGQKVYTPTVYTRNFKISLYKGVAKFYPGKIADTLFNEIEELTDVVGFFEDDYIKTQYAPTKVNIEFSAHYYENDVLITEGKTPIFYYIKGKKPVTATTDLVLLNTTQQELSRITPNSMLSLGFVHQNIPTVQIFRNGLLVDTKQIVSFTDQPKKNIHTYYNFKKIAKVGDVIEFQVSNTNAIRTQRYLVFPEGVASTHILFENDNGILEVFEFTGRVQIGGNLSHITQKRVKGVFEIEEKVTSDEQYVVTVNSGKVLPADRYIIEQIIKAKKLWICFNSFKNEWLRADASTTKTNLFDSFDNEIGMNVEFKILEDYHVRIYP